MPTTSTASRIRPLDFDCADRCASRCRCSTCAFSKLASITSIAARPWARAISAAMPAVSPAPFSRISSALIASLRSTSVLVSSSSRVWAELSAVAASSSENAGAIASLDLLEFGGEVRIADQRKAARGAFGAADQQPHVGDLLQHA